MFDWKAIAQHLGIPQDIIDMADQVEMDIQKLIELCITDSIDAVRRILQTAMEGLAKKGKL